MKIGPDYPMCEECGERAAAFASEYCPDCRDNLAEKYWTSVYEDGEAFRGNEAAGYFAELQEQARRLK